MMPAKSQKTVRDHGIWNLPGWPQKIGGVKFTKLSGEGAGEGVRLPSACLTVGHDCPVVAIQHVSNDWSCSDGKNI